MTQGQALVRLQEIDLALHQKSLAMESLPEAKKVRTVRAALKKLSSQLSSIVGQRKDAQMDLAEAQELLDGAQTAEDAARTKAKTEAIDFRQVEKYEKNLSDLAKRVEKANFMLKEIEGRLETLNLAEKNALQLQSRLVKEEAAAMESLKEKAADIRREVLALNAEREEVVVEVGDALLKRYEKAMVTFKGIAVETLRGNVPTVCRVKLQPSSYHDLMSKGDICECPYCHRILVLGD